MSILDRMYLAVRRIGCLAVCRDCVRMGEEVVDRGFFGDFGLCGRCRMPVTSLHECFWVRS